VRSEENGFIAVPPLKITMFEKAVLFDCIPTKRIKFTNNEIESFISFVIPSL
jgi:hypothetical protein